MMTTEHHPSARTAPPTDRLDWTIRAGASGIWIATYQPTGDVLVARTRGQLMSKINAYETALPMFLRPQAT